MATRLSDIVKVFSDKWTYGAVEFGYESDINKDHDRQYPALIIEPPVSVIESVNTGRENYDFELNFYNLYDTAAQDVVELQKRWDNLQDLANEWLDMVLKNYQDTTVQAYIDESGISIERVKEVGNDRLVQLKINFTISGFTKCFRPISKYPSDISNLSVWLRADSGATFDIATKNVSALADQSGNSNDFSQSTKSKQPLRYGYDGANDKTYLSFDGTNDSLESDSLSPLGADFTAFIVSKDNNENNTNPVLSYNSSDEKFSIGGVNGVFKVTADDGEGLLINEGAGETSSYYIGKMMIDTGQNRMSYEFNNDGDVSVSIAGWARPVYNSEKLIVGNYDLKYLDGNVEEVIVFNKVLNDTETADVKGYLNDKYNIY